MKKTSSLFLMIIVASLSLAAQQELNDNSDDKTPNIVVVGNDATKTKWLIRTAESKYSVLLYDLSTRQMRKFPIGEENILSAQFISIPYIKENLIEIISGTNKGNGYLYLFRANMSPILKTRYFDSNRESIDYSIYGKLKLYGKMGGITTPVSRIYRNNRLAVTYDDDTKTKTIKVAGYCDYVTNIDNTETIVHTECVEKYYRYSDAAKEFLLQTAESFPENETWLSD